eukprot:m.508764 g.508764  ORF g.508764 m.508764 type:complete len:229 (-) comp21886_c0_seq2:2751-3437(-)
MSTRKGSAAKRGQKYQNTVAFNNVKYGIDTKMEKILGAPVGAVCKRCKEKIEWRKKFKKYKILSAPASCEKCKKKTIRHSYHRMCLECAGAAQVCAMCKQSSDDIVDMPASKMEQLRIQQEEEHKIAMMRERDRRTFLRRKEREEEEAAAAAKAARDAEAGICDDDGEAASDADDTDTPLDGHAVDPASAPASSDDDVEDPPENLNWEDDISDDEDTAADTDQLNNNE